MIKRIYIFAFVLISSVFVSAELPPFAEWDKDTKAQFVLDQLANFSIDQSVKMNCKFRSREDSINFDRRNSKTSSTTFDEFEQFLRQNRQEAPITFSKLGAFREYSEQTCFLNKKELLAILHYSNHGSRPLNSMLRTNPRDFGDSETIVNELDSALSKLEPFVGIVTRGTTLDVWTLREHLSKPEILFPSFLSTSLAKLHLPRNRLHYVIYSKNCKYIGPISSLPNEMEVLCPRNSKFFLHFNTPIIDGDVTRVLLEQIN